MTYGPGHISESNTSYTFSGKLYFPNIWSCLFLGAKKEYVPLPKVKSGLIIGTWEKQGSGHGCVPHWWTRSQHRWGALWSSTSYLTKSSS